MKNTIGSVLNATDLVKSYTDFQLGPISLQLTPGIVYGLVGPNGSGETTLLNCLAGQSRSNGGRIVGGGKLIHERPVAAQA